MKLQLTKEDLDMLITGKSVEMDGLTIEVADNPEPKPEKKELGKPVWERYPKWNSLIQVEGYYVDVDSDVINTSIGTSRCTINTFRTKAQCRFSLAAAQLSQLVYKWNEECGEELGDSLYCITINWVTKKLIVIEYLKTRFPHIHSFTSFKTRELAEKFLELNTPLLEDFFMLNQTT